MDFQIPLRLTIFALAGFLTILPFVISNKRFGYGWIVALCWGGLSFGAIYLFQIPLQSAITKAILGSELPIWIRSFVVIAPSGIIQEFFKALLPMILIAIGWRIGTSKNLFGPFAGVGFGLVEAVILVGLHPSDIGWIAIVERIFAITFHVGLTTLAVSAGRFRKALWGLPIAILLHSLINFFAIYYARTLSMIWLEVIIAFISLVVWGISLKLYLKE